MRREIHIIADHTSRDFNSMVSVVMFRHLLLLPWSSGNDHRGGVPLVVTLA